MTVKRAPALRKWLTVLVTVCLFAASSPPIVNADETGAETGWPIIHDDFNGETSDFQVIRGGTWTVDDGKYALSQPANADPLGNISVHRQIINGDVTVSAAVYLVGTEAAFNDVALLFHYTNEENYYFVSLNESNDPNTHGIFKVQNGTVTEIADFVPTLVSDTFYTVVIERSGTAITVKLDGEVIGIADDDAFHRGMVGFGSRNDSAFFDELHVTMPPLLAEDFADSAARFSVVMGGEWHVADGKYALDNPADGTPLGNISVADVIVDGDFKLSADVHTVGSASPFNDVAVVFGYLDEGNYYFVSLNESNDPNTHGIFKVESGAATELTDFVPLIESDTDYRVEIVRSGNIITVGLDGETIGTAVDGTSAIGRVGFGTKNDSAKFDNLVLYGNELPDPQVPAAPAGLSGNAATSAAIALAWDAPSDDHAVAQYRIYRDSMQVGVTNETSWLDTGLAPGTAYSYYIVAANALGDASAPSGTISVTTLEAPAGFPFTQANIDAAVAVPPVWYELNLEWVHYNVVSSAAFFYLTVASSFDPDFAASDDTVIKDRVLGHIRNLIKGTAQTRTKSIQKLDGSTELVTYTNEPGSSGSLDTEGYGASIMALALCREIPEIWNALTEEEQHKITLIMKAVLVAANWALDDDNSFPTGVNQLGNFHKTWNPNMIEGGIGSVLASAHYLGGAEAANDFLKNFDYDAFMQEVDEAGFLSIKWTFSQAGKEQLAPVTTRNDFTYNGYGLDQMFEIAKWRAEQAMFTKIVRHTIHQDGVPVAYVVNNREELPNQGRPGMAHEFDSVDADGVRSALNYVYHGWKNTIAYRLFLELTGGWQKGSEQEKAAVEELFHVGTTDMIYKADHGYHSYHKGQPRGVQTAEGLEQYGYPFLKELWQQVIAPDPAPAITDIDISDAVLTAGEVGGEITVHGSYLTAMPSRIEVQIVNSAGHAVADATVLQARANRVRIAVPSSLGSGTYAVKIVLGGVAAVSAKSFTVAAPQAGQDGEETSIPDQGTVSENAEPVVENGTITISEPEEEQGVLSVELSGETLELALAGAADNRVVVDIPAVDDANGVTVKWPLQQARIVIQTPLISVSIAEDALDGMPGQGAGSVEFSVELADKSGLPADIAERIGDRPVYNLNIRVDGNAVNRFHGSKAVRVSIPYSLLPGELPDRIVGYQIADDGTPEPVKNSKYDAGTGRVTFAIDHFSKYTAMQSIATFADIAEAAWAKTAIEALAGREIVDGLNGGERFGPGEPVTREQFVKMLVEALDLFDDTAASSLSDVSGSDAFHGYIASAQEAGIVSGIGSNRFGVGRYLSRQDMAVLVYRAALAVQAKLNADGESAPFADESDIADYAATAVRTMRKSGFVAGMGDNRYAPHAYATRAQAAKLLYPLFVATGD